MSSIPNSVMPHAIATPAEPIKPERPNVLIQAFGLATLPAFLTLGLTAYTISTIKSRFQIGQTPVPIAA